MGQRRQELAGMSLGDLAASIFALTEWLPIDIAGFMFALREWLPTAAITKGCRLIDSIQYNRFRDKFPGMKLDWKE